MSYIHSGYNDAEVAGISTPTGYGRKRGRKPKHHPLAGGAYPPIGLPNPIGMSHPFGNAGHYHSVSSGPIIHPYHPVVMSAGRRGRKPKHPIGMPNPIGMPYHPPYQPIVMRAAGRRAKHSPLPIYHPVVMAGRRGRKPKYHHLHHLHGGDFFSTLGSDITHAADTVGHAFSSGAHDVGHAVSSGAHAVSGFAKKTFTPALGRQIASVAKPVGQQAISYLLPQVGKAVGQTAGVGLATLTDNPELAPLLGNLGSQLGQKAGTYGAQQINKKIGSGRRGRHPALSNRGEIVKQVMREHGMSLPQASAFVKAHGLYTPKHRM
jgi:hypothetical protein